MLIIIITIKTFIFFLYMIMYIKSTDDNSYQFSGIYFSDYRKTGVAEDFSAAWLMSKNRLDMSMNKIKRSTNMAGVSFAATRNNCKNCIPVLTRDYFDFLVEHLSTTSNQIPFSYAQVFKVFNQRIKETSQVLRLKGYDRKEHDSRLNVTVAVLIYSSITFSRSASFVKSYTHHVKIRKYFFESTFWSVFRYIPNVCVFVASDQDRNEVMEMRLPLWTGQPIQLEVPVDVKNRTVLLPKMSLVYSLKQMLSDPLWMPFQYVYYSEGDQIVHLRHSTDLYNVIDDSGGSFVLVPHRMQTLPLLQSIDVKRYRKMYEQHKFYDLPNATIITLDFDEREASCCDNGRLIVHPCGQWWYQCPDWGLVNVNPWLQFGKHGYTTPSATAHKGLCTYSKTRQLCPLPTDCKGRVPSKDSNTKYSLIKDVCQEHSLLTYLGSSSNNKTLYMR